MAATKKPTAKRTTKRKAKPKGNGYDVKELEALSLKEIQARKLVFAEEVISYLPCSKGTYYAHGLNELDTIKDALTKNRTDLKAGLRKKWYESDNATKQVALYKLIGTEEEAHRLNGTRQELQHNVKDLDALKALFGKE